MLRFDPANGRGFQPRNRSERSSVCLRQLSWEPRDVMTLAHELGHGVHQWVSRRQNYFNFDTPLTTAETASVFAEMLVFHRLQSEEQDPKKDWRF